MQEYVNNKFIEQRMYVHAAESQRTKPTLGGTGVHPTVELNRKREFWLRQGQSVVNQDIT